MVVHNITAVEWLTARQVVGGEATDFTPWLAENLDLLAEALGLDELTLREIEADVQGKSLDILADGVDQDGAEFPVIIENQYGSTDHRHLGQLVTYLAQYGPGYAVWVVEDGHPALMTAVDFLNRTSPDEVNYFVVRVRFTHGTEGSHQVDFQLLVQPDRDIKPRRGGKGKTGKLNQGKIGFMSAILADAKPRLEAAGYKGVRMHSHGSYIEMHVPITALESWNARVKIFANKNEAAVRLYVANLDEDRAHNAAALDVIRERYAQAWASRLPGVELEWHGGAGRAVGDFVRASHPGFGYIGGDAQEAADWASQIAATWLEVMLADPVADLAGPVDDLLAQLETANDESDL